MTSATVGAIDIVAWFVYLFSAVLFVVGLHFMNSPKTARKGNQISAFGMSWPCSWRSSCSSPRAS